MEEEDVQSPWRTVINTFRGNKISMTGLLIFLTIFLIVLIGPLLDPIDLSYSETSQINVGPGKDMLNIPQALNGNLQDIAIGPTYSVGVSTNGDMYIIFWHLSMIKKEAILPATEKYIQRGISLE